MEGDDASVVRVEIGEYTTSLKAKAKAAWACGITGC